MVAFLTQLEAVLQQFCSSTFCLHQSRGSTLVSLFLHKLLWRHNVTFLSRSSFNTSSLYFSAQWIVFKLLFIDVVTVFRWIRKHRLKVSDSMFIWYELFTLLPFHSWFLAWQSNWLWTTASDICWPIYFYTSIRLFKILHLVSKRSKLFSQSSSSKSSLVGAPCRLFQLSGRHHIPNYRYWYGLWWAW